MAYVFLKYVRYLILKFEEYYSIQNYNFFIVSDVSFNNKYTYLVIQIWYHITYLLSFLAIYKVIIYTFI